jgi:hypothetical protein
LAAGVLLTLVAACSGDDDAASSSGPGSGSREGTTETTAAKAKDVVDPYHGHTSKVYDGTQNWICHPDLGDDPCRDLSATEVDADGTAKSADMKVASDPAIDCFYVYPTVSTDPGVNSDLKIGPDDSEVTTTVAQAAPYAQTCRMFVPAYRQLTVSALTGGGFGDDKARALAYGDVLDAWQTYISQYNEGRGVVLIGHSQGTGHLLKLIGDEVDPNADLRSRLVSAILLGGKVGVPDGKVVGGTFKHIPGCESKDQTGCVITYSTFPADKPPAAGAFFGRSGPGSARALCVDPVALAGGDGVSDAVVPTRQVQRSGAAPGSAAIDTTYIVLPHILAAKCERKGDFDFFAVGPASADDKRPVAGLTTETLGPNWGLHLYDANVAMGDLLQIVAAQAAAFTSGSSGSSG